MMYFSLAELTRSEAARLHGIDNTPDAEARANLAALVGNLLDPLRALWGAPIRVTSGYRSVAVNRLVGGAKTSHHLRGMAADITCADNRALFALIKSSGLPFTQLIDEDGFRWLHVSFDRADLKREVLHARRVGGRWVYSKDKP